MVAPLRRPPLSFGCRGSADSARSGRVATRALGRGVVLSGYVVDTVLGAEGFGEMWARRLRWARTVKACRPAGYRGAIVTHGTIHAALFLALTRCSALGWRAAKEPIRKVARFLLRFELVFARAAHDDSVSGACGPEQAATA